MIKNTCYVCGCELTEEDEEDFICNGCDDNTTTFEKIKSKRRKEEEE